MRDKRADAALEDGATADEPQLFQLAAAESRTLSASRDDR